MSAKSEALTLPTIILALAGAGALYLLALLPAFSYVARHPDHMGILALWRPLPEEALHRLSLVWRAIDPHGSRLWQ